ncbi:heat shock 70 kDa protein 12A-like [Crassostrea angulata]|uniref:heat shock 70 kDa protein 12A-like n=1 Tax=Magallana angulata TaxID=2784310 RepID=UPI0022B13075|nr:heat shock 70 kDa protein 12A-like [Crassostrea angulata]
MDNYFSPWPVVCAIDFGTTYSGYAYSMRPDYERNPLNIECNPSWSNEEMMTPKTPTCILFDKSENFHSFGYEAEKKYRKLAEKAQEKLEIDEEDDSNDSDDSDDSVNEKVEDEIEEDNVTEWLYFRRFKMKLYQDDMMAKQKLKKLKLSAENGKKLPALKVFSEAIKYLKDHFEALLLKTTIRDDCKGSSLNSDTSQEQRHTSVSTRKQETHSERSDSNIVDSNDSSWSDDILWVLTVPAIWSDQAKQFMRDAAIQAGIRDDHLVLALEPESAALLCKQLALTKKAVDIKVQMFEPGSKFMVIDCGGGTVDVTAYKVENNQALRELHCASGDAVGGTNVDMLFINLLNDIFRKDVVERFQNKSPSDWHELLRSIEVKKRGIGLKNPNEKEKELITFSSLGRLIDAFTHLNGHSKNAISKRIQEMDLKKKIKCNGPKMRIDETYLIETVFAGPIKDIVKHLKNLFAEKDVKGIDIILLVGGFSECPLLQDAIKREFPDKTIVNPRDGSIAVMKGAVLFGHSAEIVAQKRIEQGHQLHEVQEVSECVVRRSRAYYGVATDVPFVDGEHLPVCRYTNEEGLSMCSDIFDCLIKKNQEMEIGQSVFEKTFKASSTLANVEIYRSDREVQYCHEDGCRNIGNINALYSDDIGDRRLFKIQLHFGFTEKIAIAMDMKTQKTWKAKLDCIL